MKNVNISITQDGIVSGIISGLISYTLTRDKHGPSKYIINGEAGRLTLPSKFEDIYSNDINEKSVFDIVIKNNNSEDGDDWGTIILKDVYIWPRPDCYLHNDNDVVIIDHFKFRSWL